ncbi:L-threonylcarbamoyladenylate synthase [Oceanobacillus halotolerans]|uniref:L-threonylcarbamoyladenylate synthase n=1 Tax=Oceanobacillus halotolerans TaxID=2663380 RepID=UPI0013D9AE9E|nr:L-threonylcarbamoyladenylate synthase [Oceanobacillus halotolerans]
MFKTKCWHIRESIDKQVIKEASNMLRDGLTVAFPTETVYGLGADATNEKAVQGIFQAKGRPADNPLIAHVATIEQAKEMVDELPPIAKTLMTHFSPGPITYILPSNGKCATNVTAGLSTIGVRLPDHPVAQALLKECDIPIAAPSANLSGKPSPTTADHVWQDLSGKIAGLVDGGSTGVGLESTVVDCTQDIPIILRPGGITKEQLEQVVGNVMVDPALVHHQSSQKPKSPGMKYTHYAPAVDLWLVSGDAKRIQEIVTEQQANGKRIGVMASTETTVRLQADAIISLGSEHNLGDIAASLYDALRTFKEGDVDLILCETFSEKGIGQAVMNRLTKAATRHI